MTTGAANKTQVAPVPTKATSELTSEHVCLSQGHNITLVDYGKKGALLLCPRCGLTVDEIRGQALE